MSELSSDMQRVEAVLEIKRIKKNDFLRAMNIESQGYNNWRNRGIPGKRLLDVSRYIKEHAEWIQDGDIDYAPTWAGGAKESKGSYTTSNNISDNVIELINLIDNTSSSGQLPESSIPVLKQLIEQLLRPAQEAIAKSDKYGRLFGEAEKNKSAG